MASRQRLKDPPPSAGYPMSRGKVQSPSSDPCLWAGAVLTFPLSSGMIPFSWDRNWSPVPMISISPITQ